MTSEIIFHFGLNKTGSTSIQRTFANYDDGVLAYAPIKGANHSSTILCAFSDYGPDFPIAKRIGMTHAQFQERKAKALADIAQISKLDRDRVLISAEMLLSLKPDEMKAAASTLSQQCDSIRLMAYVREVFGYTSSCFQQGVKMGKRASFQIPKTGFRRRIGAVMDAFGAENVELAHFQPKTFPNGSVVQDFAQRIGAKPKMLKEKSENESLSMYAAALIFGWNGSGVKSRGSEDLMRNRSRLISILRDNVPKDDGGRRGHKKFKLAQSLVRESIFMNDVRWMEDKLGAKLMDDPASSDDYGVRSEEDFRALQAEALPWLLDILKKNNIQTTADNPIDAMNALFLHAPDDSKASKALKKIKRRLGVFGEKTNLGVDSN